jgi:uncharacterized Zn finger protein
MGKKEDKKCPKCGNADDELIEESFSHLDDFFLFEYYCEKCGCLWSRVFSYIEVKVIGVFQKNSF